MSFCRDGYEPSVSITADYNCQLVWTTFVPEYEVTVPPLPNTSLWRGA